MQAKPTETKARTIIAFISNKCLDSFETKILGIDIPNHFKKNNNATLLEV